jgi:hypothetical protein
VQVRLGARRGWVLAAAAWLTLGATTAMAEEKAPPEVPQMLRLQDAIRSRSRAANNVGIQQSQLDAIRKARTAAWWNLGPDLNANATYSKSTRTDYEVSELTATGDTVTADIDTKSDFKEAQLSSSIRLFDGFATTIASRPPNTTSARKSTRSSTHASR